MWLVSSNSRCNPVPAVFGLFVHAANTPEKVIDVLARIGLSISPTSINSTVQSLSVAAKRKINDAHLNALTT
ncbi:hypothetical protein JAAARDRAFT_142815 [Jaapia argillacea MUCL 33604]|uniref:Uncharacterized protein n=1 Tax=Jaapia argillacea MUCL 33604 TaxID=933084 RepID=A0A067P7R8_9AGAM|nr:hypothetical protein JAAARDRAFT_142815 [Jaapia argillacea MUCL 33604]